MVPQQLSVVAERMQVACRIAFHHRAPQRGRGIHPPTVAMKRLQRGSAWERWVLMEAAPSAFGRQMQHPGMACVKVAGMGQQPCAVVGERGVVGAGRQRCPLAQHLATRVEQEVLAALVAHGDEALVG